MVMVMDAERRLMDLVRRVALAPSIPDIADAILDRIPATFGAFASGFYLLGEGERPAEIHVGGLPDRFIDLYERCGREVDPLFEAMVAGHRPIDDTCLFDRVETWVKSPLFVRCSAPYDVGHYLLGPIVAGGRLVGTINCGRKLKWPPFGAHERMMMATLSAHVSASVATLRTRRFDPATVSARTGFTRRELQIAERVAEGLSNREIAEQLWISENGVKQALKRIFRKRNITNRAALAATLYAAAR